jgi:hypothetical protein
MGAESSEMVTFLFFSSFVDSSRSRARAGAGALASFDGVAVGGVALPPPP